MQSPHATLGWSSQCHAGALVEILTIIISVVALVVAVGTALQARKQAAAAIDQAVEAGRQADSASDQAISAREQADTANRQLALSEQVRREQAEPHVVVDIVPSPLVHWIFLLVIENIGPTVARNVRIRFDPPPKRVMDQNQGRKPISDWFMFAEGIPIMPPGRRIELMFDRTFDLLNADLPLMYTVTVDSEGPFGPVETFTYKIDLNIFYEHDRINPQNIHTIGQEVSKIRKGLEGIRAELSRHRPNSAEER